MCTPSNYPKHMVSEPFDPIKDSNMVYKDTTKLNLGVGSRQRCQAPEQQNSSKLDIEVTKITPLLIVFQNSISHIRILIAHPTILIPDPLNFSLSPNQHLKFCFFPSLLSSSCPFHQQVIQTLTVSFAESQVSTLPRSFFFSYHLW